MCASAFMWTPHDAAGPVRSRHRESVARSERVRLSPATRTVDLTTWILLFKTVVCFCLHWRYKGILHVTSLEELADSTTIRCSCNLNAQL